MEEMYGFHPSSSSSSSSSGYMTISPENKQPKSSFINQLKFQSPAAAINHFWPFSGSHYLSSSVGITESISVQTTRDHSKLNDDEYVSGHHMMIKDKIVSHPLYSKLLHAYIDCQKVGAPTDISCLLDDIHHENDARINPSSASFGFNPELDHFMETFCHLLVKYKSDLARPYDEATVFLTNIESQLRNLGQDGNNISSEEEEVEKVKDKLLRKYGGRISSIKQELISKKKKKGKLPKEASHLLLQWWNSHYKWPYPTEADKIWLVETTGLHPKQINNWFINQRKRHWKPSETMHLPL